MPKMMICRMAWLCQSGTSTHPPIGDCGEEIRSCAHASVHPYNSQCTEDPADCYWKDAYPELIKESASCRRI